MTDGRLSNKELEKALLGFEILADDAGISSRASGVPAIRAHIATLQRSADEMREALSWVGEVYPATSPESGGAIVHMTWEQFNAMRAQVGLKPVKARSSNGYYSERVDFVQTERPNLPPQHKAAASQKEEK